MASTHVPCMNAADKQKIVLLKTRPLLEDTIKQMLNKVLPASCIKVADLGCASGPNTFFPTYEIMNTVTRICQQANWESPELQVFLNDLPDNDFNTVFRSVPPALKESCFITGVAGSFYDRLFPSKSIHLVHSSCCLHWLSQVPEEVENNNENIYISRLSPPNVTKVYSEQFRNDFSKFLRLRSEEMISGGRMLLTMIGRSSTDPRSKDNCCIWELLTKSLMDLVDKGLVHKSDVDSFFIPLYYPCEEEVRDIIEKEGLFVLDELEIFEVNWDFEDDDCNENFVFEKSRSGHNVSNCIRAITEPLLVSHFGETILDTLFTRYAEHVSEHLLREKTKYVNIILVMTMK